MDKQTLSESSTSPQAHLKVAVSILDELMNLAGELVLTRNQLLQEITAADMKAIELSGQRIDMITSELQETIMRTRMQPIAYLFDQLGKNIDELSQNHGKPIELNIQGKEVEVDKTILESIHLPLNILVKNCVEHGIESAKTRKQTGKDPKGKITLRASHDAGQVHICVSDNGRGKPHKPLPKQVTQGIEKLGGVIEIDAVRDEGTQIQIKLPLTLAIIPSQITVVGNERYAIPQTNLSELLRIPAAEIKKRIEKVGDADVVRLRGELLPVLNLPDMLGIKRTYIDSKGMEQSDRRENLADRRSRKYSAANGTLVLEATDPGPDFQERNSTDRRVHESSGVNIAIVFAGNYKYGLVIDQLQDAEEIVVKPLGRHLKQDKSYAGATIMGDGTVALILDILNLAQMAGLSTISDSIQRTDTTQTNEDTENKESLVIFKNGEDEYFAAPFASVERIERLVSSSIEQVGGRKVVQYRGGALPLFELSQVIEIPPLPAREQQEVIVFKVEDKEFGLMVTPPVDTLEVQLSIDKSTFAQKGIKGSMIINNHTTLFLDIKKIAKLFLMDVA